MQLDPLKSTYGPIGQNLAEALGQLSLDLVALVASYVLPHWPKLGDRFNVHTENKKQNITHATVVTIEYESWLFRLRYQGDYGFRVSAWFRADELLPYDTTPSDSVPDPADDPQWGCMYKSMKAYSY